MEKIGLFYGSDTGSTEYVSELIIKKLGEEMLDVYDVYKVKKSDFDQYDKLILGLSTWFDGDLQSDWESFFETFQTIDFSGKKVALFGLGDQIGYGEFFIDGVGILGNVIAQNGGEIIGVWPTEGYDYLESVAEFEPGWFMGLAVDEDNQRDLTVDRVDAWLEQIQEEFPIISDSVMAN